MSVLFNGPDRGGYFGVYGGIHVPDILLEPLREISEAYIRISRSADFITELRYIRRHF